jgi:hypothetical protein
MQLTFKDLMLLIIALALVLIWLFGVNITNS